ncbi:MAG: protein kinase [Catenulispora sp.]|nr:protein kinase [Catenulispora sp.]
MGDDGSGRVIGGRYRLVAVIGSGGMGRVWEGHDEQLDRRVALKEVSVPHASAAERETLVARALREGRAAAALADQPYVVPVYDVVVQDGVPWIVMQLVRGRSLRDVLQDGPLAPPQVARIADAMLSALAAADAAGVVHRDVKPGNIMLADDGRVLLTDFGIAKRTGDTGLTSTGLFVGTMEYTAPERIEGHAGGLASDLFSLGATLFQAVEGSSPFHRNTTTGTLNAVLIQPLPPFQRASSDLRTLIDGLTRKDPAQRPDVMRARALLGVPTVLDMAVVPRAGRRRALMVASSVCGVALVAAGTVALTGTTRHGATGSPEADRTTMSASQGSMSAASTSATSSSASSVSSPATSSPPSKPSSSQPVPPPPGSKITNTVSVLCIDTNGPQASGVHLQERTCGNFTGQAWVYDAAAHSLLNPPSGFCADTDGAPAKGVAVLLKPCGYYSGQQWSYDSRTSRITNVGSGLCLDTAGEQSGFVDLVLNPCGDYSGQYWRM